MNFWVKWAGDKAARKLSIQTSGWAGFCGGRILHNFLDHWTGGAYGELGWGVQSATAGCGTETKPLDEFETLKAAIDNSNTKGAIVIADRIGVRSSRVAKLGQRFFDAIPEEFETKKYICTADKRQFINRNHRSKVWSCMIVTKPKPRKKKEA